MFISNYSIWSFFNFNNSPIFLAIQQGKQQIIDLLMQGKIDLTVRDMVFFVFFVFV